MADSPNNPIQPGQPPKKELSMETRLLLAFLLMGLVLFLTPYIYKAPPPPPKQAVPAAGSPASPAEKRPEAPPVRPAAASRIVPGQIQDTTERQFTVDTDIYRIQFSNKGAVVRSWVLKKYLDHSGKPLELVNQASFSKAPPPFSLSLKDNQAADALNFGLYAAKPSAGGLGIEYEFSDGKNHAKKTFQFSKDGYLSQVATEVSQNGVPLEHLIQWRGGFG